MEPQHKVKFTKSQQNSDNQDAPTSGIQPTAKQLKTKPKNWVTLMCRLAAHACPPGGSCKNPRITQKQLHQQKGFM